MKINAVCCMYLAKIYCISELFFSACMKTTYSIGKNGLHKNCISRKTQNSLKSEWIEVVCCRLLNKSSLFGNYNMTVVLTCCTLFHTICNNLIFLHGKRFLFFERCFLLARYCDSDDCLVVLPRNDDADATDLTG